MARNRDDEFDPWADAYAPPPQDPEQLGSFHVPINSGVPAGQQDLSYWQSRHDQGLPGAPGLEDIFDLETGQLKPGWQRTARGYEFTGTQNTAPPPQTYDNYPTTYPTYTGGGYQAPARRPLASLNYPQFNGGRMTAPPPFAFDPFTYEDFAAPTITEAQQEPGFDYALNQGIKAYENSKAYLGTYKTGGTIKGLNDYARNMANQNYNQVFDRKAQTYDRNRGNAFGNWSANRENAADAYATNYGISRDVFDRNYAAAKDEYAPRARASELEFARDWDVFAYEGDDDYRRWKALVDANS